MKRIFIHNPFFRIFAPPVYGMVVYLIILLIHNDVGQLGTLVSNQEVYVSIALTLLSFESMRLVIVLLARLKTQNKAAIQVLATTVISTLIVLVAISQYYKLIIGFDISPREMFLFGSIFVLTALLY